MANPDILIKGNCYFMVGYVDSDLRIPIISTIIFIKVIDGEDKIWLFQNAESFAEHSTEDGFLAIPEDQLYSVLDINELRTNLKSLVHLHPIHDNATNNKVLLTEENKKIIIKSVNNVFKSKKPNDVITMTTNYRDKGLSIEYKGGGFNLGVFIDCKEYPEEESGLRKIFDKLNIPPSEDYLSQHERVRILSYQVQKTNEEVAEIIGDIFLKIYKIKDNEKIKPHYRL